MEARGLGVLLPFDEAGGRLLVIVCSMAIDVMLSAD
jgi:hypothetical protein